MQSDILIPDEERLKVLKGSIAKAGSETIYLITDFNRTLTKAYVDGEKTPSLISVLRDGDHLTLDYAEKAHALYNKYHAIEIDPDIPDGTKREAMHRWWTEHFDLLIKSGLKKKDIEDAVNSGKVHIRDGLPECFAKLQKHDVPVAIISSNGLGGDSISMYLEKEKIAYDNIHIISNSYIWDADGNATGVKEPIIHVANKDETVIRETPVFDLIKDRRNVILLGDSPDDIKMASGLDYDNIIKIGFLNENQEENLEAYKRAFDVVIRNDSGMGYVNSLLLDILGRN